VRAMRKRNFSDEHPELQFGEIFLQNVIAPKFKESLKFLDGLDFDEIKYFTKRLGNIAYDCDGKILPLARPVFVSRREFDAEESHNCGECI